MRYLVIERSDGGTSVRVLINDALESEEEVKNWEARPKAKEQGWTVVSWFVSKNDPRPKDRDFRDAFSVKDKNIEVDMPKARGIHMDRIREARNAELTESDKDYMRALESEDKAALATLKTKRQELRDIPQTFDLTGQTSANELRKAWPEGLSKRT